MTQGGNAETPKYAQLDHSWKRNGGTSQKDLIDGRMQRRATLSLSPVKSSKGRKFYKKSNEINALLNGYRATNLLNIVGKNALALISSQESGLAKFPLRALKLLLGLGTC